MCGGGESELGQMMLVKREYLREKEITQCMLTLAYTVLFLFSANTLFLPRTRSASGVK